MRGVGDGRGAAIEGGRRQHRRIGAIDHHDVQATTRQRLGQRQPDHAAAHHQHVGVREGRRLAAPAARRFAALFRHGASFDPARIIVQDAVAAI